MNQKPTLVVLAAGLGSRYGSLKQMDRFGPSGETLMDYTIYDAIIAGFKKIVFVIRKSIEAEFLEIYQDRLPSGVEMAYVFQELEFLPEGLELPTGRQKPWGTAHAVLMAESAVDSPFAIVNADDYYGRSSLQKIHNALMQMDRSKLEACLLGYVLKNTLTDHGKVSRGVCEVQNNLLTKIVERTEIFKEKQYIFFVEDNLRIQLRGDEIVSMNLMGFTPAVFEVIRRGFVTFFDTNKDNLKVEFFMPLVLDQIREKGTPVPVIPTKDAWFGVTYKEDKPVVRQKLFELIDQRHYPNNLWKAATFN